MSTILEIIQHPRTIMILYGLACYIAGWTMARLLKI